MRNKLKMTSFGATSRPSAFEAGVVLKPRPGQDAQPEVVLAVPTGSHSHRPETTVIRPFSSTAASKRRLEDLLKVPLMQRVDDACGIEGSRRRRHRHAERLLRGRRLGECEHRKQGGDDRRR
jgi:hypothetical protein